MKQTITKWMFFAMVFGAGLLLTTFDVNAQSRRMSSPREHKGPVTLKIGIKRGKVKFFNTTKGFGFIKVEDSEQEVIFSITSLKEEVQEGDSVTFDIKQGDKGIYAVNIRINQK